MKKLITLGLSIALAAIANADMLYWQVASDPGVAYQTAKIYWTADDGVTKNAMVSYLDDSTTSTVVGNPAVNASVFSGEDASGVWAALPDGFGTGYAIAIELFNGSDTAVAHYGWTNYDDAMANYISKAEFSSNYHAMTQSVGVGSQSGATYGAGPVPEPTSGLLVLIGAALVGLRRKKVA